MSKRLLLVRHGQSEYNKAMRTASYWISLRFWARGLDPGIRDAPLSEEGLRQAALGHRRLLRALALLNPKPDSLQFFCSALVRAMQTAILMMGGDLKPEGTERSGGVAEVAGRPAESQELSTDAGEALLNTKANEQLRVLGAQLRDKRVVALPQLREITQTLCDCGHPLSETFQRSWSDRVDFRVQEARLGDWWLPGKVTRQADQVNPLKWRPHMFMCKGEQEDDVSARLQEVKQILLDCQGSTLVLFGHSQLFKRFAPGSRKLSNCGMLSCELHPDLSVTDIRYMDQQGNYEG